MNELGEGKREGGGEGGEQEREGEREREGEQAEGERSLGEEVVREREREVDGI